MNVCAFSWHYSLSSRTLKCPGSYPWGDLYPRLGITDLLIRRLDRLIPVWTLWKRRMPRAGNRTRFSSHPVLNLITTLSKPYRDENHCCCELCEHWTDTILYLSHKCVRALYIYIYWKLLRFINGRYRETYVQQFVPARVPVSIKLVLFKVRWHTMVHVPLMFVSEWREFPSTPCLAGKKNLMTPYVSMLLKSRMSPDILPFSLCNKERQFGTWTDPSFQRHYRFCPTTSGSRSG